MQLPTTSLDTDFRMGPEGAALPTCHVPAPSGPQTPGLASVQDTSQGPRHQQLSCAPCFSPNGGQHPAQSRPTETLPSGHRDLNLSVGHLDARVYTWPSQMSSTQSTETLFCRAQAAFRRAPAPTPPTPANGLVSAHTGDEKHAIPNVSLSRPHISFYHASWLRAAYKFPATVPKSIFKESCTSDLIKTGENWTRACGRGSAS
ncbi:uncharacterized protein LOC117287130 [Fukomys damarensis]|uniref:uncharacterized protein LOC117287130 n=1 Tax=Fukomys damarensis TaxID=885580 RepID=UPI001455A56E|nr:uncharacterized protein LOC117287130 [Fukomys damarensis]